MAGPGIAHRPGAFKQSNKGHNTGRHRSKGAVEKENRGRVGVKALSGKKGVHKVLAKIDRRNKAVQMRCVVIFYESFHAINCDLSGNKPERKFKLGRDRWEVLDILQLWLPWFLFMNIWYLKLL